MTLTVRGERLRGGALQTDLVSLAAKAKAHGLGAGSDNTELAYSGQWGRYLEWCEANSLDVMTGGPELVNMYLTYLTEIRGFSPATLKQALSALRSRYRKRMGDENPTKHPSVSRTLQLLIETHVYRRKNNFIGG